MGKIDDDDEQIEEVARLLKQLTHADEKDEAKEEEMPEFHLDLENFDEGDEPDTEEEPEPVTEPDTETAEPEPETEETEVKAEPEPEEAEPEIKIIFEPENEPETVAEEELEPVTEPETEEAPGEVSDPEVKTAEPEKKAAETEKKKSVAVKKTSKTAQERRERTKQTEEKESKPEPVKLTPKKLAGNIVRKIVFCISLGVFAFALTGLLVLLWGYYVSQREYAQINDDYVVIGTASAPENSDSDDGTGTVVNVSTNDADETNAVPFLDITVDTRKLKALNEDYAFYIVIPGTNVQYPVVQGDDNNHYLRYTYSNQENTAGSIQVDYRTDRDTYLQTFNTILHGHNRQDGTMFSDLANYIDENYRDENPYIYIILDDKEYVYEIFAFYDMVPVAVCYNPNTSDETYLNFINTNNTYTCDIEVTLEDQIITLYTCNDDSSMRYLVHAVLREVYDLS